MNLLIMTIKEYLNKQIAYGRCYFTINDAYKELNKSRNAILHSISRLIGKGEIVSPVKGFYVIIPPEYKILGCIPADQFIPYLMGYLGYKYYAGLITAASYYGASHQAPQVFQVVTEKKLRSIVCGKVKINFIKNQEIEKVPITWFSTPKSKLSVSSPEATAVDLIKFVKQSGGLNNITTILAELKERMTEEKLKSIIESQPGTPWKQRLGCVLESIGAKSLARVVKEYLTKLPRVNYVMLHASLKTKSNKVKRNETWKIVENTKLEGDI